MDDALHPDLAAVLEFHRSQRTAPPAAYAHAAGCIPEVTFFSLARLQEHLNNPLLTPNWVTLMDNGSSVPLELATLQKFFEDKKLVFMDKTPIDEHLNRGGALVLEGLDILDPLINAFIAELDSALPCSLSNCVAFLSQRSTEAYEGHCDAEDVLAIQVEGEKRWRIFAPQPRRYVDNALDQAGMGTQIAEIVLRPGDALYVRAGVPHRCETVGDHSVHLSIDLCDWTPNIQQITNEANARYRRESGSPSAPVAKVTEDYVSLLRSEQFQRDLAAATSHRRNEARLFRQRIGRASGVRALERLRPP